jgi:O-antigen/teichoic acid export membrane protein
MSRASAPIVDTQLDLTSVQTTSNSMSTSAPTFTQPTVFDPAMATGRAAVPLSVGFSWSFVGWVGYALCQWLILSVTAKLGTPTLVGEFAFATALAGPIFMLMNLQLRGVQSTDARNEYCFSDYLTLRVFGSVLAVMVIAVAAPVLRLNVAATYVLLLVAGFKALESVGDVIAGLMQKYEMLDSVAISLLLRGGVSSVVFAVTFAVWRSLPFALLLWACAAGISIATYDSGVARRLAAFEGGITFALNRARIQRLALISLPLGIVSAFTSLNTNIPRYAIERVLSVSDLGIFASIAYPVTAATIVANALGQSALARLSRHFAEGRMGDFKRVIFKLIACGVGLTVCGMGTVAVAGNRVLRLLYTPEYAKQGHLFLVLALAAGLNSIACFLVYGLTAAREFKIQIPITLVCMLTTFVSSAVLVPRFRLMGAAIALTISASVQIVCCSGVLSRTIVQCERYDGR